MNKVLRYTIRYEVAPEDANISDIISRLQEDGSAEVLDVEVINTMDYGKKDRKAP